MFCSLVQIRVAVDMPEIPRRTRHDRPGAPGAHHEASLHLAPHTLPNCSWRISHWRASIWSIRARRLRSGRRWRHRAGVFAFATRGGDVPVSAIDQCLVGTIAEQNDTTTTSGRDFPDSAGVRARLALKKRDDASPSRRFGGRLVGWVPVGGDGADDSLGCGLGVLDVAARDSGDRRSACRIGRDLAGRRGRTVAGQGSKPLTLCVRCRAETRSRTPAKSRATGRCGDGCARGHCGCTATTSALKRRRRSQRADRQAAVLPVGQHRRDGVLRPLRNGCGQNVRLVEWVPGATTVLVSFGAGRDLFSTTRTGLRPRRGDGRVLRPIHLPDAAGDIYKIVVP